MILVTFSVVVTIGVLNVNFRTPATHKMAPWVRKAFIDFLPRYLFIQRPETSPENEEHPAELNAGKPSFAFLNLVAMLDCPSQCYVGHICWTDSAWQPCEEWETSTDSLDFDTGFNIVFPETLEERNSVSRLLNHAQYDGGGFRLVHVQVLLKRKLLLRDKLSDLVPLLIRILWFSFNQRWLYSWTSLTATGKSQATMVTATGTTKFETNHLRMGADQGLWT